MNVVRCGAKRRNAEGYCGKPAGWGTDHLGTGRCRLHGGSTTTHRRKAALDQAKVDVAHFGARRDVHPATALLELVQTKATEVEYWRNRVSAVDEAALTWGTTREVETADGSTVVRETKLSIELTALHTAEKALADYSSAALKAGVDAAMVTIAATTAARFLAVIRTIVDDPRLAVAVPHDVVESVIVDAVTGVVTP